MRKLRLFPKGQGPQDRKLKIRKKGAGKAGGKIQEQPATAAVPLKPPLEGGFRTVPVKDIIAKGKKREGGMEVRALAASIKRDGLLQPLVVGPEGDKYWLLAGRRRLEAVKSLGWEKVAVHILTCDSTERVEALAAVENLERRDLTPVEEALAVARLLKTLGATQGDLEYGTVPTSALERAAALLGRSPAWVRERGMLLRLCPEVLELVASKRLPLGQAREVAKLAGASDQREVASDACGVWGPRTPEWLKGDGSITIQSVEVVRLNVAARLSTLRGVPWQPEIAFAGQPACAGCPDNSANSLLFGADAGDKAPEARCLNTQCYGRKMRAAERALGETVKGAKADKAISPTAAGVRGVTPKYLKPTKVARELARVRGIGPKKGKAGKGPEKKEVPYSEQPDVKFREAQSEWVMKVEASVGEALCSSPMRLACCLVGARSAAFTQHIGYSDTPPPTVRGYIEPILKRIAHGTEDDLKALAEGFKPDDLYGYGRVSLPLWTVRHLAGLLGVNLPAEPKLEEFLPKADAEKPQAGVCRVCGCTEDKPCPGGCAWADKKKTICTKCANGQPTAGPQSETPRSETSPDGLAGEAGTKRKPKAKGKKKTKR